MSVRAVPAGFSLQPSRQKQTRRQIKGLLQVRRPSLKEKMQFVYLASCIPQDPFSKQGKVLPLLKGASHQRDRNNEIVSITPWRFGAMVVCFAPDVKADRDGAFSLEGNVSETIYEYKPDKAAPKEPNIGLHFFLEGLIGDQLLLHLRRVMCVQEKIRELERIKGELDYVKEKLPFYVLGGHGDPKCCELGVESRSKKVEPHLTVEVLDSPTGATLLRLLDDILAKDALVFFWSCSTAGITRGENIATKLTMSLPGRTIYAPADTLYGIKRVPGSFPPKYVMYGPYGIDVTVRLRCDPSSETVTAFSKFRSHLYRAVVNRRERSEVSLPPFNAKARVV